MSKSRLAGFSLVEVMVALIVMSVGLLGIAKMQALALSSTGTSRARSLAALEAASLASTMRADRSYWAAVAADPNIAISAGAVASATDSALTTAGSDCTSAALPCTTAQVAAADLNQWAADLAKQVPNGTAAIACSVAAPPVSCTITITWTENIVASNTQQAQAAGAVPPTSYILYVDP